RSVARESIDSECGWDGSGPGGLPAVGVPAVDEIGEGKEGASLPDLSDEGAGEGFDLVVVEGAAPDPLVAVLDVHRALAIHDPVLRGEEADHRGVPVGRAEDL